MRQNRKIVTGKTLRGIKLRMAKESLQGWRNMAQVNAHRGAVSL